jgi:hypothetical protein
MRTIARMSIDQSAGIHSNLLFSVVFEASTDAKHPSSQLKIESKLCRMGVIPDKKKSSASVTYVDK